MTLKEPLEQEADRILGVGPGMDTSEARRRYHILTESQILHRTSREVLVKGGIPDASLRRGTYGRALSFSPNNSIPAGLPSRRITNYAPMRYWDLYDLEGTTDPGTCPEWYRVTGCRWDGVRGTGHRLSYSDGVRRVRHGMSY